MLSTRFSYCEGLNVVSAVPNAPDLMSGIKKNSNAMIIRIAIIHARKYSKLIILSSYYKVFIFYHVIVY